MGISCHHHSSCLCLSTWSLTRSVSAYGTANFSDLTSFVGNKLSTSKGAVYDLPITGAVCLNEDYAGGLTVPRIYLYDFESHYTGGHVDENECCLSVGVLYSTTDNLQGVVEICSVSAGGDASVYGNSEAKGR